MKKKSHKTVSNHNPTTTPSKTSFDRVEEAAKNFFDLWFRVSKCLLLLLLLLFYSCPSFNASSSPVKWLLSNNPDKHTLVSCALMGFRCFTFRLRHRNICMSLSSIQSPFLPPLPQTLTQYNWRLRCIQVDQIFFANQSMWPTSHSSIVRVTTCTGRTETRTQLCRRWTIQNYRMSFECGLGKALLHPSGPTIVLIWFFSIKSKDSWILN